MPFVEYPIPPDVSLFSWKGVKLLFCFLLMIVFGVVDQVDILFFLFFPFLLSPASSGYHVWFSYYMSSCSGLLTFSRNQLLLSIGYINAGLSTVWFLRSHTGFFPFLDWQFVLLKFQQVCKLNNIYLLYRLLLFALPEVQQVCINSFLFFMLLNSGGL